MREGCRAIALLAWASGVLVAHAAQELDVTVRRAPYVISSVSTKSEKAWAPCKFCGSKTSYERTYKWDVYNHVWCETTSASSVPDVCRKCRVRVRDQEKLDRRERELDSKIEYQETKSRIRQKQERLRQLRQESR